MERKTRLDPAVQVLLDEQEICELLTRYCRGVDRCDEKLVISTFLPGAEVDIGIDRGDASEVCSRGVKRLKANYKFTMHRISNILIEVEGHVAYGETYCCAYQRFVKNGREFDLICGLRYIDRFEKSEGAWKISSRRHVYDWNRVDPSAEQFNTGYEGAGYKDVKFVMGARWPDDFSCQK